MWNLFKLDVVVVPYVLHGNSERTELLLCKTAKQFSNLTLESFVRVCLTRLHNVIHAARIVLYVAVN